MHDLPKGVIEAKSLARFRERWHLCR